jgi:hypothetical protein
MKPLDSSHFGVIESMVAVQMALTGMHFNLHAVAAIPGAGFCTFTICLITAQQDAMQ